MVEGLNERIEAFVRDQYIERYDARIDRFIQKFEINHENNTVTMFVTVKLGKFIGRRGRVIISVKESLQEEFGDSWDIDLERVSQEEE